MILRRLIVLLALVAAVVGVQSASAANSPNMRLNYSLLDPTSGRTDSDIAFWGNIGVAGNYDGFRVFNTQTQQLLANYLCRGPQNDVSLWEHNGRLLLFQSIDTPQTNGGTTVCSAGPLVSDTTACGPPFCFEGIRIFDLTDPAQPGPHQGVYTDCGSHTHTLVPDLANNRVLLYISSYPGSSGPNCQSPFRKISIVQVPLNAPETASVLSQPPLDNERPWLPRHHRLHGDPQGGRVVRDRGPDLGHHRPGEPGHAEPGARRRPGRELLALGRVHVGRAVRRLGRRELHGHVPAGRRREDPHLPGERRRADELVHDPAPAGRATAPCTTATSSRSLGRYLLVAGLVLRRHVGGRLHEPDAAARGRVLRPRQPLAANPGRPTGTTAGSTRTT